MLAPNYLPFAFFRDIASVASLLDLCKISCLQHYFPLLDVSASLLNFENDRYLPTPLHNPHPGSAKPPGF